MNFSLKSLKAIRKMKIFRKISKQRNTFNLILTKHSMEFDLNRERARGRAYCRCFFSSIKQLFSEVYFKMTFCNPREVNI